MAHRYCLASTIQVDHLKGSPLSLDEELSLFFLFLALTFSPPRMIELKPRKKDRTATLLHRLPLPRPLGLLSARWKPRGPQARHVRRPVEALEPVVALLAKGQGVVLGLEKSRMAFM